MFTKRSDLHPPNSAEVKERMIDAAKINSSDSVLNPCYGDGDLAIMSARLAGLVIAIDVETSSLDSINKPYTFDNLDHYRANFLSIDQYSHPELYRNFDVVIMDTPLNDSEAKYIRHAFDFVRSGGRLVCLARLETVGFLDEMNKNLQENGAEITLSLDSHALDFGCSYRPATILSADINYRMSSPPTPVSRQLSFKPKVA